ncbi:MAG TPA: hypothetical protein PL089_04305 [Ignavibacteria bacterium]|nr:hypothetical protein [Ignavibacteria bacterium]
MTDSKLVSLLKTFSKSEFKNFEKFVSSPYFSKGRDLMPLFKALKIYYPQFSSEKFSVKNIYESIFPGKNYGDTKSNSLMKTLISELYKMCIDFLAYSSFKEDEKRKSFYVLDQIRRRKHYIEFEKEYEKIINDTNKGGITDFIERYFLYSVYKNYSLDRDQFNDSFEYTLATDENIVAAALMMSFMIEDVKNTSDAYNIPMRYNLMNNLLENLNTENLLEEMKINSDRFYPYVLIFYMIYKMNKHKDNTEYYYELKKLVAENKNLFGREDNFLLSNIMLTYVNVKLFPNEEYCFLYEYMLENNIYKKTESDDFHIILFRNIVVVFSALEEYEKLENFIQKYSSELHIEHRDNMYNFSFAHLNFIKGNFEKALEYTGKINYDIFIFKLDARILLMKIYYELSYFEQAYSLIDSITHFLRYTNEFSDIFKNHYNNFIKNFHRLLKLKTSGVSDSDSINILEMKIKKEKQTGNILWLQKKIDEMKL